MRVRPERARTGPERTHAEKREERREEWMAKGRSSIHDQRVHYSASEI
jgi:hypothetical protein